MSKYTLLFDANFWLMKTFHICAKIKGKTLDFKESPEDDKNLLLWKLASDFAAEIKRFESVTDRVVYCSDSSSWRKNVSTIYKAHRKKDKKVDWSAVFKCHDGFILTLKKLGVIVCNSQSAEADDLIFVWSTLLNHNKENAIIISGDNDLLQLVNFDQASNSNTIYYNKFDKNLHVFNKFNQWLTEPELNTASSDIFNMHKSVYHDTKSALKNIVKSSKMEIKEVAVNDFVFKKILIGDEGDGVTPLHVKLKGTRVYRVTEKHANDVINLFKENKIFVRSSHFFNDETILEICEHAKKVIKIDKPISEIVEKWRLNRDLVYLHNDCIPKTVLEGCMSLVETYLANKEQFAVHQLADKNYILDNSEYVKPVITEETFFKTKTLEAVKTTAVVTESQPEQAFNADFWDSLTK